MYGFLRTTSLLPPPSTASGPLVPGVGLNSFHLPLEAQWIWDLARTTQLMDRANEPLPPASKCSPSSLTLDNDPWWLARTFLSLGSITHSEPKRRGRGADFLPSHVLILVSKVLMTLTGTFHQTRDLERGSFIFPLPS